MNKLWIRNYFPKVVSRIGNFKTIHSCHPVSLPAKHNYWIIGITIGISVAGISLFSSKLHADALPPQDKTPIFKRSDVAIHNSKENRIWITYQDSVYDVTDFVDIHPGGERILLAAGKAIDPYWGVFVIHQSKETKELLETYRIGDLLPAKDDPSYVPAVADPGILELFKHDPQRHASLITRSARPCNAESAVESLETFVTPNELFYVRNHLPVPSINPETFVLEIEGPGIAPGCVYTLNELKTKFEKTEVMATIQCAGNRRQEMHETKPVKGLLWTSGAIGNAVWSGVKLVDVLKDAGYRFENDEINHVHFNGAEGYGASIPVSKALDPKGDVILAYEMNGEDIPVDHGYPLRALVPGHVAARSVKWVNKIELSDDESPSHWQQRDYKGFSPSATLETSDYSKAESIQVMPVQSAIISPKQGEMIEMESIKDGQRGFIIKGYAWSGGGSGINRVDISVDGGVSWRDAQLEKAKFQNWGQQWAWTKWEAFIPAHDVKKEATIVCKAVDSAYQAQPEKMDGIYNVRGVLVNAWHNVKVFFSNHN